MSLNKNVADYTDFSNQKTMKKIVQPPGGQSTFTIGWTNEATDYGPTRNKKSTDKKNQRIKQSQPILPTKQSQQYRYQQTPKQSYKDIQKQSNYKQIIGGEYGYGNYSKQTKKVNNVQQQTVNNYQYTNNKNIKKQQTPIAYKPPKHPSTQSNQVKDRACIRIKGAPESQITFGDNSYNYWKDDAYRNEVSSKGFNKNVYENQKIKSQSNEKQMNTKTSVKISNQNGSKSNFKFG